MKNRAMLLMVIILTMCLGVQPVYADVLNQREMVGPYYQKFGTAKIVNMGKDGGAIVLTASSSPDATYQLFDILKNTYCRAADLPVLGDFLPGCDCVDFANGFLHYVDSNVKVYMLLKDPSTGAVIGNPNGYVMRDGQVIWLGNDHAAYEIWFKTYGSAPSFVRLKLADNVQWY